MNEADAAEITGSGKTGDVADYAATDGHENRSAVGTRANELL